LHRHRGAMLLWMEAFELLLAEHNTAVDGALKSRVPEMQGQLDIAKDNATQPECGNFEVICLVHDALVKASGVIVDAACGSSALGLSVDVEVSDVSIAAAGEGQTVAEAEAYRSLFGDFDGDIAPKQTLAAATTAIAVATTATASTSAENQPVGQAVDATPTAIGLAATSADNQPASQAVNANEGLAATPNADVESAPEALPTEVPAAATTSASADDQLVSESVPAEVPAAATTSASADNTSVSEVTDAAAEPSDSAPAPEGFVATPKKAARVKPAAKVASAGSPDGPLDPFFC
jgi:hypothetical protein